VNLKRYKREASAFAAYVLLLLGMAWIAPAFFNLGNLRDLAMNNASVLLVAIGMTLVILTGEIDISVGSQFAVCTVAAGWFAKTGVPILLVLPLVIVTGSFLGAIGGAFVGWLRMPSIVVTLALMVAWRDGLRWITEGAWVQNLPSDFQWFGFGQPAGQLMIVVVGLIVLLIAGWALRNLRAGRAIYAVGSDAEAARLAGIEKQSVVFVVFVLMGAMVGLAAALNAARFSIVPSNAGMGLELKAIAAVVVGGTAITGGRGTLAGTLIGVALLGTIGTALTFAGINPFWEKAIQGAIILVALVSEVAFRVIRVPLTFGVAYNK
jgi:rhamnose transport system permease protein